MPQDQRILDLIAAASEQKPANVGPIVNELVGERISAAIEQRREDTRANFFAEPEGEDSEVEDDFEEQDTEEEPDGEDA